MIKFTKYSDDKYYASRNDEYVATIYVYYNYFSNSNFYVVDDVTFKYLKDAKNYVKENY